MKKIGIFFGAPKIGRTWNFHHNFTIISILAFVDDFNDILDSLQVFWECKTYFFTFSDHKKAKIHPKITKKW